MARKTRPAKQSHVCLSQDELRALFASLFDAVTGEDGAPALAIWKFYPLLVEILVSNIAAPQNRYSLWHDLDREHDHAAKRLMRLAIEEKFNTQLIYRSKDICQRVLHECDGLLIRHPGGRYDTWPECVSDQNDEVPPEERQIIRAADAVVQHLAILLESAGAETLKGSAKMAFNYIRADPGALGKNICSAINLSHEHFRKQIVPQLKRHGVTNQGRGYHPPVV